MTDLPSSDDRLDAPRESRAPNTDTDVERRPAGGGASGAFTDRNWRPTWISSAIALLVTVATAGVIAARVGPIVSVVVAASDAVLFAVCLWLIGRERWRALAHAAVAAMSLFVGGAFVVGAGYAALSTVAAVFPVAETAQIAPAGLHLATVTAAVVGAGLALLGGVAAVGNVLREDTVRDYAALTTKTVVVPLAVATVMILAALARNLDEAGSGPEAVVADAVGTAVDPLLTPAPGRPHLLAFCLVAGVTAFALARAVDALPLVELADGSTAADVEAAVAAVRSAFLWTAVAFALAVPVAALEVLLGGDGLRTVLPDLVYGFLTAVTGSHLLRTFMVALIALAVAVVAVVAALRWIARTPTADVVVRLAPVAGGAAVVAITVAARSLVLDRSVEVVATRLPPAIAEVFRLHVDAIVAFYGTATVSVALGALLVGTTAALSFLLALVIALGFLPEDLTAPALASAGLFVAAAFAGAAGAGAPLVVVGVVAALLAWDLGAYGVVLGREAGRRAPTRGPELTHVGATLAVGVLGALGAAGLFAVAGDGAMTEVAAIPVAVASLVVALLALLAALR